MRSLKELLDEYKNGEMQLREDEYIGDDGLIYCKKCNASRIYVSEDKAFAAHCQCKCQSEAAERQKQLDEFVIRKKHSGMDALYRDVMFTDAIITENNGEVFAKCHNYVAHAREVIENNIGLYIYGDNSTGKTFMAACLCNELLWAGFACIYTSLNSILNDIQSSYDGSGVGEGKLLNALRGCDFVFIDDLGKEFIGREYDVRSAKWAEKKLYNIINARYAAKRPTVFTSNYSIADLAGILSLDKAIVERIDEMATRTIRLHGDDFRAAGRKTKSELAKKLGI